MRVVVQRERDIHHTYIYTCTYTHTYNESWPGIGGGNLCVKMIGVIAYALQHMFDVKEREQNGVCVCVCVCVGVCV